jgi:hypothetical protein
MRCCSTLVGVRGPWLLAAGAHALPRVCTGVDVVCGERLQLEAARGAWHAELHGRAHAQACCWLQQLSAALAMCR